MSRSVDHGTQDSPRSREPAEVEVEAPGKLEAPDRARSFGFGPLGGLLALFAGLLPVLVVFLANPLNRVYSHHGLLHASITYRLYHTGAPPTHPFLADRPLPYYWGYHWLAAKGVALGMTPSWAGVVINLLALAGSLLLAWWIAKRLLRRGDALGRGAREGRSRLDWACLLAVFGAVFAPSFLPAGLMADQIAQPLHLSFMDPRAVPVAIKFVNQSGMTLGILFTLSWIASLVALYEGRRTVPSALAISLSLLGCAFFYPPMLPSLVLGTPFVALLFVWRAPAGSRRREWNRAIVACLAGAVGVSLTLPYLLQVAQSLGGSTRVFDPVTARRSLAWGALLMLPTWSYFHWHRGRLREGLSGTVLLVLIGVLLSSFLLYMSLSQSLRTEYKYFSIAMLAAGFIGGAALGLTWRRSSLVSWCLAIGLLATPSYAFYEKLYYNSKAPRHFEEVGPNLVYVGDPELEELFAWMRNESPPEAVFLDPTGLGPVYGQRGALIVPAKRRHKGFGGSPYEILPANDKELLAGRTQVMNGVASSQMERELLPADLPVFRIAERRNQRPALPGGPDWLQVHVTSGGRFRIQKWVGGASPPVERSTRD